MNRELIKKLAKQQAALLNAKPLDILVSAFPEQLAFINDPAKRKAACSSRRAGKSSAVGIYLINECLKTPNTNCLYISRTKESAENIMWNDIIDAIIKKNDIKAEPIVSKLQLKFNNGSILYLTGADANEKQMRALVGKKYSLVVIDEAQYFTNDLEMFVYKILTPTLGDLNATICIIGTPGNNMTDSSFWYRVATKREPGWSIHEWHWKQNPFVRDNVQKQIDELLQDNPLIANTPWFKQEYNNEWVPEADARVYKSTEDNYVDQLPDGFLRNATFLLSIDLGYHDATAFLVGAYNKIHSDKLYILESTKRTKLTITAVAQLIKEYQAKYKFRSIYVDAANKQAVEEMRQIHNLPLLAAEKLGKEAHITLLNSDFITQNVFILKGANQELIQELNTLIWDVKRLLKGDHKEDQSKENHLTDAILYAHHGSRHFWYKPPIIPVEQEEAVLQQIEKQYGVNKPKNRYLKSPWWQEQDEI